LVFQSIGRIAPISFRVEIAIGKQSMDGLSKLLLFLACMLPVLQEKTKMTQQMEINRKRFPFTGCLTHKLFIDSGTTA